MSSPEAFRDRLRRVELFSELEDADLDRLAGIARVQRFEKKAMLFGEDEPYRGMFVILDGLAVVYKISDQGRMLILQVCRSGSSVAETPLLDDGPDVRYAAYGKCTRESEVLFLPKEKFVPFLRRHPEVAWEMLRSFAARMRELSQQLEGITLREVTTAPCPLPLERGCGRGGLGRGAAGADAAAGQGDPGFLPRHGAGDALANSRSSEPRRHH